MKNLVIELLQAVDCEHDLLLTESSRINAIISEAAAVLRINFMQIDKTIRDGVNRDFFNDEERYCQNEYKQIVATLQFEDIVSQIICQQIERGRVIHRIIVQGLEALDRGEEEYLESQLETLLLTLRQGIKSYLSMDLGRTSVNQRNLTIGETELF